MPSSYLDSPACRQLSFPPAWREILESELDLDAYRELCEFVHQQRLEHRVFPPEGEVYQALEWVAPEQVRVVILGQDPYHGAGQAHGLAFSVQPDVKAPPSLANIFKELESDLGIVAGTPCLQAWAEQGVLLLNTVLTVRESEPNSHQRRGWERVTDGVIRYLARQQTPIVFLLWGKPAEKKAAQIGAPHVLLSAPHPSPLSAHRGFFGSRPFSSANAALVAAGLPPIDWSL
ncbi:MAG: uracil-DNA glycosylase [Planctomycetales bacterium]|nr:uracil-DNA glycosylase [Planctomycetales bacterium]